MISTLAKTPWWAGISQLPAPSQGGSALQDWAERRLQQLAVETGVTLYQASTGGHVRSTEEVLKSIGAFHPGKLVWGRLHTKEKGPSRTFWAWEDGALEISGSKYDDDGHVSVWVMCADQALAQKLVDIVANNLVPMRERSVGRVYVIGRGMMGYDFYSLGVASVPIERQNYTKEVLTAYDDAVIDMNTLSPRGRLTIFDGPPGTGKTFLVRALIDTIKDGIFVFVPPALVDFLASPEMIPMLIQKKASNYVDGPIIFLLEDADNLLVARSKDNLSLISTLLNMTSGILGSMLDIRAVATTNSPKADIDPALMRKGRISAHVTVGKLDKETATKVFTRLTGKHPSSKDLIPAEGMTLGDVYYLARENGWVPPADNGKKAKSAALANSKYEAGPVSSPAITEDIAIYPGKPRSWL